jgi:hypothetical protein
LLNAAIARMVEMTTNKHEVNQFLKFVLKDLNQVKQSKKQVVVTELDFCINLNIASKLSKVLQIDVTWMVMVVGAVLWRSSLFH